MKNYKVIEDNGGGLTLVVFAQDGETIEFIHTGYEYNQGWLAENLEALKSGDNPGEDWDNNELGSENPKDLESWFPWNEKGIEWNVVADNDGIYPENMGEAAKIEFGIDR